MSLFVRDMMTPVNEQKNFISAPAGNNNNNNNNNSDSPLIHSSSRKSMDMDMEMEMPSPPLSPYTRTGLDENETDNIPALLFPRASKPITSDLRVLESYPQYHVKQSMASKSASKAESITPSLNLEEKPTLSSACKLSNANAVSNSNSTSSFAETTTPVTSSDEESSLLHIDPYKNLNKPGFKKISINFLSEYQFKNFTSHYPHTYTNKSSSSSSSSSSRSAAQRSYETVKQTTSSSNYASDSDMEKRRTRRLVRQNNLELESVENNESVISRPSTPINRKRERPLSVTASPSSPATPKRQRTSTPIVYNYDYKKIEDFCPSLDTLPQGNKSLRTDWKGQSMDLSTDPLVNELHPAEIVLASILRLPCAVYLDSKRRIFHEKVKRMRSNLPFRRTDAQKSCKIDVNKASRLFASFEKVGWFDEKHFQKFM